MTLRGPFSAFSHSFEPLKADNQLRHGAHVGRRWGEALEPLSVVLAATREANKMVLD